MVDPEAVDDPNKRNVNNTIADTTIKQLDKPTTKASTTSIYQWFDNVHVPSCVVGMIMGILLAAMIIVPVFFLMMARSAEQDENHAVAMNDDHEQATTTTTPVEVVVQGNYSPSGSSCLCEYNPDDSGVYYILHMISSSYSVWYDASKEEIEDWNVGTCICTIPTYPRDDEEEEPP